MVYSGKHWAQVRISFLEEWGRLCVTHGRVRYPGLGRATMSWAAYGRSGDNLGLSGQAGRRSWAGDTSDRDHLWGHTRSWGAVWESPTIPVEGGAIHAKKIECHFTHTQTHTPTHTPPRPPPFIFSNPKSPCATSFQHCCEPDSRSQGEHRQ